MSRRNCKSCVHSDHQLCLYILNTGHRRPCPAANGCKAWEADHGQYLHRQQVFPPEPNHIAVKKWDARAMELYRAGMSDGKIAADLCVSTQTVASWRQRNGLPSRQPNGRKLEHDKVLALYQRGLNDVEIGKQVGVHPKTVAAWRYRHGLSVNRARRAEQ